MQFKLTLIAAFAALATAVPLDIEDIFQVEKRQSSAPGAANVVTDLQLTGKDLATLNNTINGSPSSAAGYTGPQYVDFVNENQQIIYDINNATAAANATKSFDAADSSKIASARDALIPTVSAVLSNLDKHYAAFKTNGTQGFVANYLQQQEDAVQSLFSALGSRVTGSPSASSAAASASATLISYFNQAIKTYQQ